MESLSQSTIQSTHTLMNDSDRASFDSFCIAIQSFPHRLAERPELHNMVISKEVMNVMSGQQKGKMFVNTRRQNLWSVVHVGVLKHSGKMEEIENPVVIYRFQLRYADIPIEPVIEVTEPIACGVIGFSLDVATRDLDVDVRRFNKRVADAIRAVLGGASHSGISGNAREGRMRGIVVWRPRMW